MHIVLLTNFIPPYRLPVLRSVSARVDRFTTLVSTEMEANRSWVADWEGINVIKQRTITVRRSWRHPTGFRERQYVHFPVDTISRLSKLHPDVVISAEFGFRSLLALVYGRLHACPVVIWATLSEVSEMGRSRFRRLLRRWMIRRSAGFLVNGASGKRYLASLGAAASTIYTVGQVSSATLGEPKNGPAGSPPRLLFVGQVAERKGLLHFLESTPEFNGTYDLCVVGDGPQRDEVAELCRVRSIPLDYRGLRSYDQIGAEYARADILLMPSLADEWGLVVNEALAAGVPVLGSRNAQAVEELVQDEVNGWTFDPNSREEMQGSLARALAAGQDPEFTRFRSEATESVRHLTADDMAIRIVEATEQIVS